MSVNFKDRRFSAVHSEVEVRRSFIRFLITELSDLLSLRTEFDRTEYLFLYFHLRTDPKTLYRQKNLINIKLSVNKRVF